MSVDQQAVQPLPPDPGEWSDAALEAVRDRHPDQRLRLMAAQELERRAVIQGLCMAKMQDASDTVMQELCDHSNLNVQAWAMEERSRRVAQRHRDIGQKVRNAEEAVALYQAAEQAARDEMMAKVQAEYGPVLDRAIKSRRYRDQVAAFKRQTVKGLAKGFCQRVARNGPGYRVAAEALRFYLRKEITASQLVVFMNAHLQVVPVIWQVAVTDRHGLEHWTIDDGGASNGWRELALLMQAHLSLGRFRICQGCEALFYDASPRGDRKTCGKLECRRRQKRGTKQQERARKRRTPADESHVRRGSSVS